MEKARKKDRITGTLAGAVVGDALGVPVEFQSRDSLRRDPVTDMRGSGTHNQPEGTWSDDSSMTFCLMESILAVGWDPADQAHRYARWAFDGHWTPHGVTFDIGGTTRAALARFRDGITPPECGGRGERDNGNGALMRVHPVAIWLAGAPDQMFARALSSASAVTHAHRRSRLASVYYGFYLRELLRGSTPDEALDAANSAIVRCSRGDSMENELPHLERLISGTVRSAPKEEIRSGGYVIDTLEAAIWSLLRSSSYVECVLTAVNLGGDTDTTGTVAGALAGAWFGHGEIPREWPAVLARGKDVASLINRFTRLVLQPVPFPGSYWILQGKLLAGEYPRTPSEKESVKKLESLLDAGITTCVDLTEKGEYGLLGYSELLATLAALREVSCKTVRIPIGDATAPSETTVRHIHSVIRENLTSGNTVYVHCWGGHGRTGTVAGTWLIENELSTRENAIETLAHLRGDMEGGGVPSPETGDQIRVVRRWREQEPG